MRPLNCEFKYIDTFYWFLQQFVMSVSPSRIKILYVIYCTSLFSCKQLYYAQCALSHQMDNTV